MFSAEVNVVFGFEPSGLAEKIILAPGIGTPRTLTLRACDDESEFDVVGLSVLVGVAGVSFFTIFGTLIFGSVNCPIAGTVRKEVTAITAARISDEFRVIT
jgi:hypothetical protein